MVIGRMVEAAVAGKAEIDYREAGLLWKISAPVEDTLEGERITPSAFNAR